MALDQNESWMNLNGGSEKSITGDAIIGQIFFATNETNLDVSDLDVLDGLAHYMKQHIASAEGPFAGAFKIGFIGWADHRGAAAYNSRLSEARAKMVRAYFDSQFIGAGGTSYWRQRYSSLQHGAGEGKARGAVLAQDRRVDITSSRKFKQRIEFGDTPVKGRVKDTTLSRIFRFRVIFGYQLDVVPGVSFGATRIEIQNPRNGKTIKLKLMSAGGGVGLPIGISKPGEWEQVDVGYFMEVTDFEGRGEIVSASGGFDSSTQYCFFGPNDYGRTPEHQRSADEPIIIKQSGPDLSVGVGSMPGFWERYE